jgi:hypothetical protein
MKTKIDHKHICICNSRERFCESPDETFFNGKCLPIDSTEHCPSGNMSLVDGPDNNGFCDCLDTKGENNLQIIFSDQTGLCYSQNTRVIYIFSKTDY